MNVDLYLRDKNATEKSAIMIRLSIGGYKYYRISTGVSVHPEYWNKRSKRVRNNASIPQSEKINRYLENLERKALDIGHKMKDTNSLLSSDHFRKILLQDEFFQLKINPKNFWSAFDLFLQEKAELGGKVDLMKDYNNTLRKHLLIFEKWAQVQINFLTFKQNTGYYEKLVEYLTFVAMNNIRPKNLTLDEYVDQQMIEIQKPENARKNPNRQGLKANSIGKVVKNLKAYLNYCMEREYMPVYSLKHFKVSFEEVDNAYVTQAEIDRIKELPYEPFSKKDIVRDLFLFCCCTGFRYGDLVSLIPVNFSNGMVNKLTGKTGKRVVVPLNPMAKAIAEKFEYHFQNRLTYEQEFNQLIKEICREADMNEIFRKVYTINGVRKEEVFQKWEVISSHTCRRSFCTNLFKRGMNLEDIALFSGHSAIRILKLYIKLTPEEKVLNFLDYFK